MLRKVPGTGKRKTLISDLFFPEPRNWNVPLAPDSELCKCNVPRVSGKRRLQYSKSSGNAFYGIT
jgi:hypothetical protein